MEHGRTHARTSLRALPAALLVALTAGAATVSAVEPATPVCGYQIVAVYPHDPTAFTEGLSFDDGTLLESTGLTGQSSLRRVELTTGAVLERHDLAPQLFGEGLAVFGERIFQLTYRNHTGMVYDRQTFDELTTFAYAGEGWGLTHDGSRLVRGDGSAALELWDPETLTVVGSIEVHDENGPVDFLNELEYIAGEIFANIWTTDTVARIDPASGRVNSVIDLSGLLASQGGASGADVLNGIAWDAAGRRLFVTGKWWPWLFEIALPDCPIGLLFGDGFESGDASAWSGVVTAAAQMAASRPAG